MRTHHTCGCVETNDYAEINELEAVLGSKDREIATLKSTLAERDRTIAELSAIVHRASGEWS